MDLSFYLNFGCLSHKTGNRLISGDNLVIGNNGCITIKGDVVLKFSKNFNETISRLKDQGYHLKNARINFILFWKDSEKETELKIILPELDFEKK